MFHLIIIIMLGFSLIAIVHVVFSPLSWVRQTGNEYTDEIPWTIVDSPKGNVSYRFQPAKFNRRTESYPPFVEISVPAQSSSAFEVWARSAVKPVYFVLGFCPPLKTGSRELDAQFVFAASDWGRLANSLREDKVRETLKTLSTYGFNRFNHDGRTLTARIIPFRRNPGLDHIHFLNDAARALSDWGEAIVSSRSSSHSTSLARFLTAAKQKRTSAGTAALFILTVISAVWAGQMYPLTDSGKIYKALALSSLACWIPFMVVLRNKARLALIPGEVLAGQIFFKLAVIVGLCWGGLLVINGAFDRSTARTVRASILNVQMNRYTRLTSYNATVQSWLNASKTIELRIPTKLAAPAMRSGSKVEVTLHAGRLGWPWIEKINVITSGVGK